MNFSRLFQTQKITSRTKRTNCNKYINTTMTKILSRSGLSPRLPEISELGFVPCRLLPPDIMLQSLTGQLVAISAPITSINIIAQATFTWDGNIVNHAREEKGTLNFITNDYIPDHEPLAFVLTTPDRQQYIVGKREGRFPVINYSDTTGQRTGDRAARTYTVTYVATKAAIECVV